MEFDESRWSCLWKAQWNCSAINTCTFVRIQLQSGKRRHERFVVPRKYAPGTRRGMCLFSEVTENRLCDLSSGGSKGGAKDACPPGGPNSFNFMQFSGKYGKIVCWRPPWGVGAPSSGKSWIRHCLVTI